MSTGLVSTRLCGLTRRHEAQPPAGRAVRAQPEASVKAQLARRARHVVPGRIGCSVGARGCSVGARGCSVGARGCSVGARGCSVGARGCSVGARGCSVGARGCTSRANVAPGRVREGLGIEIERSVDEAEPVAAPQRLARREREVGPELGLALGLGLGLGLGVGVRVRVRVRVNGPDLAPRHLDESGLGVRGRVRG